MNATITFISQIKLSTLRRQAHGAEANLEASPTKPLQAPAPTDAEAERALNERLDRARAAEAYQLLESRNSALHGQNEVLTESVKALKREMRETTKKMQEATEKALSEQNGRSVLATLVKTLRGNQSEISALLSKLDAEKGTLEASVSAAEAAATAAMEALARKDDEAIVLRASLSESEAKLSAQSTDAARVTAEVESLRTAVARGERTLDDSRRAVEAAEAEQASLRDSFRHQDDQLEAHRKEIRNADERSDTTSKALASLAKEFEVARRAFDEERSAVNHDLESLRAVASEMEMTQAKLRRELDEERSARQSLESERDALTEALTIARQESKESEQQLGQRTQELEFLKTKHSRLLAATQMNTTKRPLSSLSSSSAAAAPMSLASHAIDVGKRSLTFSSTDSSPGASNMPTNNGTIDEEELDYYMTPDHCEITPGSHGGDLTGEAETRRPTSEDPRALSSTSLGPSTSRLPIDNSTTATKQKSNSKAAHQAKKQKTKEWCPVCSDMPYGLMAICNICSTPYHTICLPNAQRNLKPFTCSECKTSMTTA